MYLGTNLMSASHHSNLEGHFEAWDAVQINDGILQLSGGAWDRVPDTLCDDERTGTQMAAFLDDLSRQPVAGWKDPRTTITFPVWKPHLGHYRLVAALRHPLSVARSLELRDGMPPDQGLRLWYLYNERLLQYAEQEPGLYLFDYDQPEEEAARCLNSLCRQLGLQWSPAVDDVFNPLLRHHVQSQPLVDGPVKRLYESLRERARAQTRASEIEAASERDRCLTNTTTELASSPAASVAGAQSERDHRLAEAWRSTDKRLSKLVRIYQLQNGLMQEYSRWQVEMMHQHAACQASIGELRQRQDESVGERLQQQEESIGELRQRQDACCEITSKVLQGLEKLGAELAALRATQQEQAAQLLECRRFVFRIRNSLPFRLRRALAQHAQALRGTVQRLLRPRAEPAA
jgi:hypothetical protein